MPPPAKFYPWLAFYHLLPLHFPLTTWLLDAPFGRFSPVSSRFKVNGNVSWFLMEITSPVTFLITLNNCPTLPTGARLLSGLYLIHYTHRAIISPLILSPKRTPPHIIAPLLATTYNVLNGFCLANHLSYFGPKKITLSLLTGAAIWAIGFGGNVYHDEVLNDLRRDPGHRLVSNVDPEEEEDKKVGKGRYAIPRGGLYRWISYPNYFCEWIEWTAFACSAGPILLDVPTLPALTNHLPEWMAKVVLYISPSLWPKQLLSPPWIFLVFLVAAMLPRALRGHRWYEQKFGNRYPKERKAAIPFLL